LLQTGLDWASGSGCYRNTALTTIQNLSVYLLAVVLLTKLSHTMPDRLALVDALDKARHGLFTLGCRDLLVAMDHKPLPKIFFDRALSEFPNPD